MSYVGRGGLTAAVVHPPVVVRGVIGRVRRAVPVVRDRRDRMVEAVVEGHLRPARVRGAGLEGRDAGARAGAARGGRRGGGGGAGRGGRRGRGRASGRGGRGASGGGGRGPRGGGGRAAR